MRVVLLNALPITAFPTPGVFVVKPIGPDFLRQVAKMYEVVSYIRHPATARLLSEIAGREIPVGAGLYRWEEGDLVIVAVLKKPVRGQEAESVTVEDLELYQVIYSDYKTLEEAVKSARELAIALENIGKAAESATQLARMLFGTIVSIKG